MLDFFVPKTKLQAHNLREIAIESVEILGIGQINPYYRGQFDDEVFLTVVNFANEESQYDEREGLVLTKFFTVKKCPRCKKVELIPTRIKINLDATYLKNEEEIAFDAFEEHPSRRHKPSVVEAYCNNCSSCFEIRIKMKDNWVKEAKKIKTRDLITQEWEKYQID